MQVLCDFSSGSCPRCGFRSEVERLHLPCGLPDREKRLIHDAALRHKTGFPDGVVATESVVIVPEATPAGGPGTELSKLLKRLSINPTPTCQCRAKAREMDAWGPDECEKPERIEEVLGVMREEAKARGLPFLDVAGRMLIRRAIRNARRAAS